ncbi:N-acetyltransferase eso1 [Exophiala dermatitidis]|uniref:DNA polymerase eta n=1 Tax=Exophiala dermatitidis TaxID=5970 RepID=A0AAN6EYC4_EXODE|nr:N-acetyltransferase eso1 [Exophiala dermatitidis]KAJ4520070.1 N-acetyltransferase eso1 [Exophiala dermatitidis]KAJ4523911.1 N-acetyltransferase eso1 [Exophiala dermatitidis]KAJ4537147.1 N-acetyltransferase eso1 [Exophiala dermatitidis]KAJ4555255.1 N-acetyltransferase eso1 [Exophiala dermatitidis]
MSSSQPFNMSSPVDGLVGGGGGYGGGIKKRSRFTYKHLQLLSQSSTSCPLRVIALIDYDAFYAQCEMVRLGVSETQPLAVQQWQGLIAINYPARAFGLNRHVTVTEAKTKCPELVVQHVATWREGDDKWAYRDDAARHIHTDKVSLDPYRLESRRTLALLKEILPPPPVQKVEKASIDEVFLDLSAQIYQILLERYPELRYAPYDDPTEPLPLPPSTALNWHADALVDLDLAETEDDDPDWDDVAMNIGAELVRGVRQTIYDRLKYTCSAGIARNKMMAKLGAGYKKPNQQTIVRNRAVQHFLSGFKFTKIRNLGGKLGDHVVDTFGTDEVTELLAIPIEQLKTKLGDDTGTWLYGIIRGEDNSEVNSRTQIKSMLSAKSFRPSINSVEQANRWLRIFVADIYARLVEEGVTENKRRPKTITLHHRQGAQTRSQQLPIPQGKKIDENTLFELAKTLLGQVVVDGRAWPCANLSLSVGGFEDGVAGNKGIDTFLLKGDEAKAALEPPSRSNTATPNPEEPRPEKRRRLNEAPPSIARFFSRGDSNGDPEDGLMEETANDMGDSEARVGHKEDDDSRRSPVHLHEHDIRTYFCKACQKSIDETDRIEHEDWHFARELQAQETPAVKGPSNSRPPGQPNAKPKRGGIGTRGRGSKPEKGQSRLAFG